MYTTDALAGSRGEPASASLAAARVVVLYADSGVDDPIEQVETLGEALN